MENKNYEPTIEDATAACPLEQILEPRKLGIANTSKKNLSCYGYPTLFPEGKGCPFTPIFPHTSK